MQLSELAKKPELVELTISDEETVKKYGEPIIFYTWDRVPLDVFSKLAGADQRKPAEMIEHVRKLMLDKDGKEILSKDQMLPQDILIKAIAEIVSRLGN